MPGGQRRPGAPGGVGQRPGTPGLPPSPFAGRRTPAGPPVLNGRPPQGVPGAPRPGSGNLPPGATRPVLGRPQGQPSTPGQQPPGRPAHARRLPGGLGDPLRLTPLTKPANPVLNVSLAGRAPFSAVGVPDALRGVSSEAERTGQDERPLVRADLAARVHGAEPISVNPSVENQQVRDEDVFAPETPGGGVLAKGTNDKGYQAEERATLPGRG